MGFKEGGLRGSLRNVSVGATEIPDSVVTQYRYEDDSDTTVAIDSIGNNPATISGATYTADAIVGSLALDHDGSDDESTSDNTVDLSALGSDDSFEIAAHIDRKGVTDDEGYLISWSNPPSESNNQQGVGIQLRGGGVRAVLAVNDTLTVGNTVSAPSNSAFHLSIGVTQSEFTVYIDNSGVETTTHSEDITQIGAHEYRTGLGMVSSNHATGIVDDFALCNRILTSSERQHLVNRAN